MDDVYSLELSELFVDFLNTYRVNVTVTKCDKINGVINLYVKPEKRTRVRDILNLKTDISVHFAPCLSIEPLFNEGVIRITVKD